ncbi:hypothetical protein M8J77_016785 [Diaphorina citri]|nr:hypothetical protein M8J77_016785 [Diaphorina citri]
MPQIGIVSKLNVVVPWMIGGVGGLYITAAGTANTFLIHQYQNLFEAYENAKPVPLSDKLKQLYNQVLQDTGANEMDMALSHAFMSIRPTIHHIGLTGSKYSFRIGIPSNFNYKSEADINPNVKIESKLIDWNSEEGKILKESLVLSENAQKFAIAQEVYKCDLTSFYLHLSYPALAPGLAYIVADKVHEKMELHKRSLQLRTIFYAGMCFFAYGLYVLLTDQTTMITERMALKSLAALGKDYIEGGIEYFDKQLKFNRALRSLLHDGKSNIATTGNYNYFVRQKALPLTYQKEFLEGELKKLSPDAEESLDTI